MKAIFALVLALLAISNTMAQAPAQCEISYYDYAPPATCDDSGCSAIGPAAYAAVIDTSNGSMEINIGISEIEWSGDCFCLLRLWTGPEGTGDTTTHRLTDSGNVMISDIWDQPDQSFRVACLF